MSTLYNPFFNLIFALFRRTHGGRRLWESKDDRKWGHDKFEEMNLQERHYDEVMVLDMCNLCDDYCFNCSQLFIYLFLYSNFSLSFSLSFAFLMHRHYYNFRVGEIPRVIIEAAVKVEVLIEVIQEGIGLKHLTIIIRARHLRV